MIRIGSAVGRMPDAYPGGAEPTDQFWPFQARHPGIGDQEVNRGHSEGQLKR